MHESALVDAVITASINAAKKEKLKSVDEIVVAIGELQQIDGGIFTSLASEMLKSADSLVVGAKVTILREPAEFECKVCGKIFKWADIRKKLDAEESEFVHFIPEMAHVYIKCDNCGSPDFEVTKGRGVYIKEIRGEK